MNRSLALFAREVLKIRPASTCLQQWYSTFPSNNAEDNVVVLSDNGSTIVCWHPEQPFPYEFSRPLPEESAADESVLKTQPHEAYKVFRQKSEEVVRQELMKITHTTKHRWFPRARDKYAKKTPRDREYL